MPSCVAILRQQSYVLLCFCPLSLYTWHTLHHNLYALCHAHKSLADKELDLARHSLACAHAGVK